MKGTYTILLSCKKSIRVKFGKLGSVKIRRGYYLYTGSALGRGAVSLEGRLKRHARRSKKARWHVDYLTSNSACEIAAAVCLSSRRRLECSISRTLGEKFDAKPVLRHIGATDCRCDGHLLLVRSLNPNQIVRQLIGIYFSAGPSFLYFDSRCPCLRPIALGKRPGKF
mgnify:CR=1 FL=1